MALTFRPVPLDQEPAASLEAAMRAEVSRLYDDLDLQSTDMPAAGPRELGPPGGTFVVGSDEAGRPVCCGGIKRLPDGTCELKRMYVVPEARGRGAGRELLLALEDAARGLGYTVARLDTGDRQPGAERLYRNAGYAPIDNFNGNPVATYFGEKVLWIETLIAWLDAGRRQDREAMLAMLAPAATWQGVRPEWVCATPEDVVTMWLDRAAVLGDVDAVELTGRTLTLRAASLAAVDPVLRGGVRITFEVDGEGRITRLTDAPRAPDAPPEAPIVDGRPQGPGWYVLNAADARWMGGFFGACTNFEGDVRWDRIGVNIGVLEPGQPACWYHEEDEQEDFLVLKGDGLLLVDGQERPLRQWDFVHCPPWVPHVFVGAGDGRCAILALGGRSGGDTLYPVADVALRHRAGVREATSSAREAYAGVPEDTPVAFDPDWLP